MIKCYLIPLLLGVASAICSFTIPDLSGNRLLFINAAGNAYAWFASIPFSIAIMLVGSQTRTRYKDTQFHRFFAVLFIVSGGWCLAFVGASETAYFIINIMGRMHPLAAIIPGLVGGLIGGYAVIRALPCIASLYADPILTKYLLPVSGVMGIVGLFPFYLLFPSLSMAPLKYFSPLGLWQISILISISVFIRKMEQDTSKKHG